MMQLRESRDACLEVSTPEVDCRRSAPRMGSILTLLSVFTQSHHQIHLLQQTATPKYPPFVSITRPITLPSF